MDTSIAVGERDKEKNESAGIQNLLRQETELHITEGRVSVQKNQERVNRIRQLKEQLQKDKEEESDQSGPGTNTIEREKLLERRMRMRETHEKVIEDELIKMERELEKQQVTGIEGEMLYLRRERHILVLQIEALRRENQQAHADLETQYTQHQQELNTLREESLQVFRVFREVLEEQKRTSEERYRRLLIDAIQDAVHLSTQNLQLQEEIQQLRNNQRAFFSNQMPMQN
ncbi:golgin subfamily A member 6-like protein 9 [Paramisgurnus dabryanus]|uniref:golgin subfamily A member 6-like protein 9 n=1 Tax=Paramisgurnus dabryanus TaxID=90735 RepID=UPI003CCF8D6A